MSAKDDRVKDGGDYTDEVFAEIVQKIDNERIAAQIELANEDERRAEEAEANRLPDRPSKGAPLADWVDYCVALGASREDLTSETHHTVSGKGVDATVMGTYVSPEYGRAELVTLADRLGG